MTPWMTPPPPEPDPTAADLAAHAAGLGLTPGDLYEAVCDAARVHAAAANRRGLPAQLAFLAAAYGADDTHLALEAAARRARPPLTAAERAVRAALDALRGADGTYTVSTGRRPGVITVDCDRPHQAAAGDGHDQVLADWATRLTRAGFVAVSVSGCSVRAAWRPAGPPPVPGRGAP